MNMASKRQDNGDCTPCPFSEPGKGDASNPVYQNPPSESDPDCFTKNTAALLSSLNVADPSAPGAITAQGCKALADLGDGDDIFHVLYHLDKTYCGLGQAHSTGDDPNVNSILTNCSHLGISNLADPGWPSSSYQCTVCQSTTGQSAQTASPTTSASAASTTKVETASQGSSPAPEASSSTFSTLASSGSATITTPFLTSPTSTGDPSSFSASEDNRLPTQGIAAIAVCTTLAIAAALILLLYVLRRRRKRLEAYSGGMSRRISRITNASISPGRDTYEPLISPSHSFSGERPPLTPPLRLSDRKILPSLLRPLSHSDPLVFGPPLANANHSSSSLYSTTQSTGDVKHKIPTPQSPTAAAAAATVSSPFTPSSPSCAPITSQMVPRLEKMQTHAHTPGSPEPPSSPPYTRLKSPPPVSFTFPPRTSLDTTISRSPPPHLFAARKGHRRGNTARHPYSSTSTSVSSGFGAASGQDYHSAIINTIPGGSSSPTRPHRPHETLLEIPDLMVSPLSTSPAPTSPPPTMSLPPPPPIGIAKTTGLPPPPQEGSGISLHSLAEQHRQKDRDSWGSWGDEEGSTGTAAGRMFGVAFPPTDGGSGSAC